ncbi:hypothetical protein V8B55DRAFT_1015036 [Mucor lusitanicus]
MKSTSCIINALLLLLLTQCVVFTQAGLAPVKHYDECDCFVYLGGAICPGSTFQFEREGKHGYCKEKRLDENGKCKCYDCDSCYLINLFDYR